MTTFSSSSDLTRIQALLSRLPVGVSPSSQGPGAFHVTSSRRSSGLQVDVYLSTLDDAARFSQEFPAHQLVPPVWKAALAAKQGVAWAGGYLAVRQACLPQRGRFRSAKSVNVLAIQRYEAGSEDSVTFDEGAKAYLALLWALVRTPVLNRAS